MTDITESLILPGGAKLKNRLAKPALSEGLSDAYHRPTERHVRLYRRWAEGGAGLLITGNVMVDRRHLERPGNVVIEDRLGMKPLTAWAAAVRDCGAEIWMQISHPGRRAPKYATPYPVSASDWPPNGSARCRQLSTAEIEDVIERFAFVARIAGEAGFTGVQIQAAEGYLIHQFLDPKSNRRGDHFGGALENRARFLREIVKGVRATIGPQMPLSVKLDGAGDAAERRRIIEWLAAESIDLLELAYGPGPEELKRLRAMTPVPIMATAGFASRSAAAGALTRGEADVIGLDRPLCVEPDLPARLMAGEAEDIPAFENNLRLGPGIFGPQSPFLFFKSMNEQGRQGWFLNQLVRMADGLDPDPAQGLYQALRAYQAFEQETARAIRKPLS